MKTRSFALVFVAILGVLIFSSTDAHAFTGPDTTLIDSLGNYTVTYQDVDLLIEYGWTDPEKITGARVVIIVSDNVIERVEAYKPRLEKQEFFLRGGIVAKILDRNGKIIRILGGKITSA